VHQTKNATVVSYKLNLNKKIILQPKRKSKIENNRPKRKSRKYKDSFLDFWFTFSLQNKEEDLSVLFAAS